MLDLVGRQLQKLTPIPARHAPISSGCQRHFDEIRDLERQISACRRVATGTCQQAADPGADPAPGGAQGVDAGGNNTYATNLGYSGEEERARVFCDLVHMALTCDLTRVASLMFTMFQSHMNMYALTGQQCDLPRARPQRRSRQQGHAGGQQGDRLAHEALRATWSRKLRDTPEGGGSLLDNVALVFLHEGGHGLDTATGEQNSTHSTENMACLDRGARRRLQARPARRRPPASTPRTSSSRR